MRKRYSKLTKMILDRVSENDFILYMLDNHLEASTERIIANQAMKSLIDCFEKYDEKHKDDKEMYDVVWTNNGFTITKEMMEDAKIGKNESIVKKYLNGDLKVNLSEKEKNEKEKDKK